jgi:hypothetical protein
MVPRHIKFDRVLRASRSFVEHKPLSVSREASYGENREKEK